MQSEEKCRHWNKNARNITVALMASVYSIEEELRMAGTRAIASPVTGSGDRQGEEGLGADVMTVPAQLKLKSS